MLNDRRLCGLLIIIHADVVHGVLDVLREIVSWIHRYAMMLTAHGHHLSSVGIEGAKVRVLGQGGLQLVSTSSSHGEP